MHLNSEHNQIKQDQLSFNIPENIWFYILFTSVLEIMVETAEISKCT